MADGAAKACIAIRFDGRYAYISPTAEGYRRQHHDDPRPREAGEAGGGRALVDSGTVAGGRRGLSVGRLRASRAATIRCASAIASTCRTGTTASSSSTSPTCGSRSSSLRRDTSPPFRIRRIPPADAEEAQRPRHHARGRRGRRQAARLRRRRSRGSTTSPTSAADADRTFQVPGARSGRRAAAGDDGLPPAVRALSWRQRDSVRLVRAGAAARRRLRSVRAEGGRLLPARSARRATSVSRRTTSLSTRAGSSIWSTASASTSSRLV